MAVLHDVGESGVFIVSQVVRFVIRKLQLTIRCFNIMDNAIFIVLQSAIGFILVVLYCWD